MKELKCSQKAVNGTDLHPTVLEKKAFSVNEIGAYLAFLTEYSNTMPMKSVVNLISVAETTPL